MHPEFIVVQVQLNAFFLRCVMYGVTESPSLPASLSLCLRLKHLNARKALSVGVIIEDPHRYEVQPYGDSLLLLILGCMSCSIASLLVTSCDYSPDVTV